MWLLTRRDDIVRVLADWERYTTDSPASTIRDIFGSHMLTTDGDAQIRYKRRFIGPFRRGKLERNLLGTVQSVLDELMKDLRGDKSADLRARGGSAAVVAEHLQGAGAAGGRRSSARGVVRPLRGRAGELHGGSGCARSGEGGRARVRGLRDAVLARGRSGAGGVDDRGAADGRGSVPGGSPGRVGRGGSPLGGRDGRESADRPLRRDRDHRVDDRQRDVGRAVPIQPLRGPWWRIRRGSRP